MPLAVTYSVPPSDIIGLFLRKKILIVEDIIDNQVLINLWLKKTGAKVDIASNGNEAVRSALQNDYDLIIMDIQMPLMDGHEATQKLRSQGYSIPIVALTANPMDVEQTNTKKSGFNECLSKPVKLDLLLETMRRYLNV